MPHTPKATRKPYAAPSFRIVLNRRSEMQDCDAVDPTSLRDYEKMRYYINAVIANRCIAYLVATGTVKDYERWETEQRHKQK